MSMNSQGRPSTPVATGSQYDTETVSGSKGLCQFEPLIFETDRWGKTGVDLPKAKGTKSRLGGVERIGKAELPGLSEPETVRHLSLIHI